MYDLDYDRLHRIKKDFVLRKMRTVRYDFLTDRIILTLDDNFYVFYDTREVPIISYLTPNRVFDKVILTKWNGKIDLDWKETNYELL